MSPAPTSATTGNASPLLTCSVITLMLSCARSNTLDELRRSRCGSLRLHRYTRAHAPSHWPTPRVHRCHLPALQQPPAGCVWLGPRRSYVAKAELEQLPGLGVDLVELGAGRIPYVLASINRRREPVYAACSASIQDVPQNAQPGLLVALKRLLDELE